MLIDFGSDFGVGSGNSAVHGRGSVGLPRGGGKRPNFFSRLKKIENEDAKTKSKNEWSKGAAKKNEPGRPGGGPLEYYKTTPNTVQNNPQQNNPQQNIQNCKKLNVTL